MINILADSGCDLTDNLKNRPDITTIPLTLQLGDEIYIDNENLDTNEFRRKLTLHKKDRKTSAPAPGLFAEKIRNDVPNFIVTLSAGVSGAYNSAVSGAAMYREEHGKEDIFVVDSMSASTGEILIVNKLLELDKKGLGFEQIKKEICRFRDNIKTYFILENYDTFVDSGRLNPYVAKIAKMLNIIPICGAEGGKAVLRGQARGEKNAHAKLLGFIEKENVNTEERDLAINHIGCPEKAEKLRKLITDRFKFKSSYIIPEATGLCSLYADLNGLIIAF